MVAMDQLKRLHHCVIFRNPDQTSKKEYLIRIRSTAAMDKGRTSIIMLLIPESESRLKRYLIRVMSSAAMNKQKGLHHYVIYSGTRIKTQ
jgi:hypothetical protein